MVRLRVRGLRRRMGHGLKTPKGAISFALGLGFMVLFLAPNLVVAMEAEPADIETIRMLFPIALMALCALTVLTSVGEQAIYFSPAEVAFLFAGPFGRRELLAFKVVITLVGVSISTLLFSIIMLRYGVSWYTAYAGLFLSLTFVHLVSIAALLVGQMIAERAYTRARQVGLAIAVLLLGAAVYPVMAAGAEGGFVEIVRTIRGSWALRYVLLPLEPLAILATAQSFYPDVVVWGSVAVLMNLALFGVVLSLDSEYRDTAVSVSRRMARRFDQLRRSGPAARGATAETATFRLPRFSWWGGAGPVVWRQILNAVRNSRGVFLIMAFMAVALGAPIVFKGDEMDHFWTVMISGLLWLSVMMTMALRFDFRADLEQMDWLKTMPFRPMALAAGQLVVPVVLCTVFQAGALALAVWARGRPELLAIGVLVAVPINLILFGVENILFLMFPTRHAVFNPGDLEMFGRQLLLMIFKTLCVLVCCAIAFGAGAIVYIATGKSVMMSGIVAWCVLAGASATVIPASAWAYERFDVSLDMPAD